LGTSRIRRRNNRHRRHKKRLYILTAGLKAATGFLAVVLLSLLFILCYDLMTQCSYFKAEKITVSGIHRLSKNLIYQQAQIKPGVNIMAVNLAVARKRLLAHPWIAAVQIQREIPSVIRIVIREHRELAVIDLGRQFLIDEDGNIFKECDPADPRDLPVIHGLRYSDLNVRQKAAMPGLEKNMASTAAKKSTGANPAAASLYDAVIAVLRLSNTAGTVVPSKEIKKIQVDRQIGLTVYAYERTKAIKLGFNNYADKYALLKTIVAYLKHGGALKLNDIDSIDLNNPDRIIVNLLRGKKEV
jgi:cell division protein FtsQ